MTQAALTLALVTFAVTGGLPRFFFRSDGTFNLKWWATAWPFFAAPALLALGYLGYLSPLTTEGLVAREVIAVLLFSLSIGMQGLTVGTNRVPLALWHQENDAPVNIVTYGAYRYIRHPFYSSFLVAMLGAVILFPHALTAALFVYLCIALNTTAAREERRLSASTFGKEYQAYVARTGRFLPRIGG